MSKKKELSVKSARKNLFSGLTLVGGILGLIGAFVALIIFLPSVCDMISRAVQNNDMLVTLITIICVLWVAFLTLLLLVPTALSAYNIFTLFFRFSLKLDEIERIKPYEKKKTNRKNRYEYSVYYLHGIYFKGGGKYLDSRDPDSYHVGDRYFVARSNNKILAIYSEEIYELNDQNEIN